MTLDLSVTAKRLLDKLGANGYVKLVRTTGESYNPVTGESTGGATETIPLSAAVLPMPDNLMADTRVKATDEYFICAGDVHPLISDTVLIGGISLSIAIIEPINHAGTPQVFEVVARG